MESDFWNHFSKDYDDLVFSLTKFPQRRKQILEKVKSGRVLHIGCGSMPYMNKDLIGAGNCVVATDFCQAMLDRAQERFSHPDLEYVLADSRQLPFENEEFDCVVSVNSILPPERFDVYRICDEVYRVLKSDGVFVAFLCSYDNVKRAIKNLGLEVQIDDVQMRIVDTTGWQCFHTPDSIGELMERSRFEEYDFRKVFLRTKAEIEELKRFYGVDTSRSLAYEYLLSARKCLSQSND